jgi:hypothetical protein
MRLQKDGNALTALLEIAWLLGSWAISFGWLGWIIGFKQLWARQLDIQMHNTYFVLPPWAAALPLFLFTATSSTSMRVTATRFRRRSTLLVFGILAVLWTLFVAYVVVLVKLIRSL